MTYIKDYNLQDYVEMNKKVKKILQSFNIPTPPSHADLYKYMLKQVQAYDSEIDVLAIFPGSKIVLCIETKSCLHITKQDTTLNDGLDKAMKQLRKLRKFFTDCHSDILCDNWSFIGAIAVPMIEEDLNTDQLNEFKRLSEDPFFLLNAT